MGLGAVDFSGPASGTVSSGKTISVIHATPAAMLPVARALGRLDGARVLDLLDEALLTEVGRYGGVTAECERRMAALLELARSAGSHAVLVTCNIYTSAITRIAADFAPMPVLAVDLPMIDEALRLGRRIGVLATVANGLEQQSGQLHSRAAERGTEIELVPILREDAFAALVSGDGAAHDRILLGELPALAARVDVVVLAQASIARLRDVLPPGLPVPVLSSPERAAAEIARMTGLSETGAGS
jgi:glutamate racemase